MNLVKNVSRGFLSPLEGLTIVLKSSKNLGFAFLPFFVGLVVVVFSYVIAGNYLSEWVVSFTQGLSFFESFSTIKPIVDFFLLVLSWLLVSLINFVVGYLFIIVFAGPFYALMVENIFKMELSQARSKSSLKLALNMFIWALGKLLIFGVVGIICFILSFVPGLNFLAPVIVVLMVAFDCFDYAFEVDALSLKDRFRFFFSHLGHFVGLGLAILCVGWVPGLFFILLPLFICGASKMYIQLR